MSQHSVALTSAAANLLQQRTHVHNYSKYCLSEDMPAVWTPPARLPGLQSLDSLSTSSTLVFRNAHAAHLKQYQSAIDGMDYMTCNAWGGEGHA